MSKLAFLLLLMLLPSLKTDAQDKQYQAYAVGFYNVENLFDTTDNTIIRDEEFLPKGDKVWTTEKYKDKIANLASVISQLGLDLCKQGISVLGVSEIENDTVLMDLVKHPLLRSRNYDYVHLNSRDRRGIDVGLIYDKDVFTPDEWGLQKVDLRPIGGTRPTRDILWVKGSLEGEEIIVTVNHWPSRSGGEKRTSPFRNEAAKVNRLLIDSLLLENPTAKIIVMGDMNDDPNNKSMTSYLRCKSKIKSTGADDMYNPYHQLFKTGLGTTAYRDR
ncbi:MAG: endonuclease/exonuclease/phosphatase family protein, partial [Saprospiraceae bacterium]|nr:endonuclease/exonuclease/phosphatase family protein [Saprospiraceae bacterium]